MSHAAIVSVCGEERNASTRSPSLSQTLAGHFAIMYTQCRYGGADMTTLLAKWGNSLALRIPKSVAAEVDVHDGDAVDVSVHDGVIVVRPAATRYSINDLAARITPRNRHRETDWEGPVGNESW
jgi:antitoxin MazE